MSTDSLLRSGVVMIRLWLTNSESQHRSESWSFLPRGFWRLSSLRAFVAGIRFVCGSAS